MKKFGPKILIVEDQAIVARDIEKTLKKQGFAVTGIADSGEDAFNFAASDKPDVILMDIVLKGKMDGIDATQLILQKFDIPIIFLTAYSDKKTKSRAKKVKHHGFLTKPYQKEDLFFAVQSALCRQIETGKKKDVQPPNLKNIVEDHEQRALDLLAEGKDDQARILLEENIEIGTSSCLSYDLLLNLYDIDKDYTKIITTINNAITYCIQKKHYRRLKKKMVSEKMLRDLTRLEND